MATKRARVDLDPDYEDVTEQQTKRQRFLEEDAKETARRKIENVIQSQFSLEIQNKEEEVTDTDLRLNQCRLVMDRLRACIIANFYSKAGQQKFSQVRQNPNEPPSIHPTVKEHIGKTPKCFTNSTSGSTMGNNTNTSSAKGDNSANIGVILVKKEPSELSKSVKSDGIRLSDSTKVKEESDTGRGSRFKMKKRIVVGNVSKYIPIDRREENDQSTHKWMVYVRGPKEEPNIDHYVKKVWFFLHPSYRPNDLVEVSQPPFHLTRRGWGEFPVRVQLHFKDQRNKRVDVIHQLKLDRTYTGLQTLGSETVVDIELEKEPAHEKTFFDLKIQLKGSDLTKKSNTTLLEQQKQKLVDQTKLNGLNITGNTSVCSSNDQTIASTSSVVSSQTSPTKNSSVKKNMKSPNKVNEKGDNQKAQVSKGDNSNTSTVILQSILSPKTLPGQQLSKVDLSNNVVLGIVQPTKCGTQVVQPLTQTLGKADLQKVTPTTKQNLIISPTMVGNNSLILQPSTVDNKLNTMIIRPTLQKNQSNMLFIQSVPHATSTVGGANPPVIINPALQSSVLKSASAQPSPVATLVIPTISSAAAKGKPLASPVRPATATGKPQTVSALLQLSAAAQKQSTQQVVLQNSSNVVRPTTPAASTASQTLYYRCKDAHGNIFLVPQPALKQVLQSPSKISLGDKSKTTTTLSQSSNTPTLVVNSSPATQGVRSVVGQQVVSGGKSVGNVIVKPTSTSVPIILNLNPNGQSTLKTTTASSISLLNPNGQAILTTTVASSISLLNPNGQSTVTTTTGCGISLLKSAVLGQEATTIVSGQKVSSQSNSTFKTPAAGVLTTHKQTPVVVSVNNSPNKPVTKVVPCITSVTTATSVKPSTGLSLKSGTSLLFTVNSSNGKTVVMPAQSIFTNKIDSNSGQSLLSAGKQMASPVTNSVNSSGKSIISAVKQTASPVTNSSQTSPLQNGKVHENGINVNSHSKPNSNNVIKQTTSQSVSASINNSVTVIASMSSQSQGQLKVTSQGLKVIDSSTSGTDGSVKTSGKKMCSVLSTGSNIVHKAIPQLSTAVKIDSATNFSKKGNCVSLLSKEYQKPLISSNNPSSLLPKTNLSLLKPSSVSTSIEKSQHNLITSSIAFGEKKIHLDLRSETERCLDACEPEKRIICLRKKSEPTRIMLPCGIIEAIKPLKADDYPDTLSLVRAAVKRHPLVSLTADKYQHPYCASTVEEWLSWKLGKRRASEWQRACFCRKFIRKHVDGDTFKGEKLWTTKQIMLWCRLHALSPHYLESTLHPFGVELTADRIGKKFSSVTCQREMIQADMTSEPINDIGEEDEIDIMSTEQVKKKSVELRTLEKSVDNFDLIPPSPSAVYVQDSCQKIGVKFEPSEVEPGVHGSVSEDMVFLVMKSFIGDVLTEMFANKISNGRYPDSLGMTDVFNALKNVPQFDFLSNCHLGVKSSDTGHR